MSVSVKYREGQQPELSDAAFHLGLASFENGPGYCNDLVDANGRSNIGHTPTRTLDAPFQGKRGCETQEFFSERKSSAC